MKLLLVGDPHAIAAEITDCQKLIDYVLKVANENNVDKTVFLGDIFHTHRVLDLYVLDFWTKSFQRFDSEKLIVLKGNHDEASSRDENSPHALNTLKNIAKVIDEPYLFNNVLFMPYVHKNDKFIKACQDNLSVGLICHQGFNGAKYENGFPILDGVELDAIPQTWVRSGHIHSKSQWGKLKYVGSSRWRSASDANQEKSLTLLDISDSGAIVAEQEIDLSNVLTPLYHLTDTEQNPVTNLNNNHKYVIDIKGTKDYVNTRKKQLVGDLVRIRTFVEDVNVSGIRESEGIKTAFHKFFEAYKPPNGSDKKDLETLVKERLKFD